MNPYALISLAVSFTTFATGIIIYQNKPGYSINRIFALLCLFIAFYTFAEFGFFQAESYERASFWLKMSSIWAFQFSVILHFTLLFTGKLKKIKRVTLLFSYISAAIILILELTTNIIIAGPVRRAYGWTYTLPEEKIYYYLSSLWTIGIALTCILLMFLYYYQATERLSRKQTLLVLIGFVIPLIFNSIFDPLFLLLGIDLPYLFTLSILIGVLVIGYAIQRYRMFSIIIPTNLKVILNTMPDIFLITVGTDGIITEVNSATEKLLGYPENKLKGRALRILFTGREWDKIIKRGNNDSAFNLNDIGSTEFNLRGKKGKKIPVLLSISQILSRKGDLECFIFTGKDLTERKEAEKQITESEERFRALFEYAHDAIFINDINGKLIDENRAAKKISGYKKEELIGKNIFTANLISVEQMPAIFKLITKYKMGKQLTPFEVVLNRKDGTKKHLEISTFPLREENRSIVINIARDITERKKMEQKLREREEKYRTVIENAGEGIAIVDENETFTFANPAAEKIFGIPPGGLIGQSLENFIDSENFRIIREQTKNRRQGLSGEYVLEIIHPVKSKRFINVTASPMLDEDGSFTGTFGVFRDITEQRRAEKEIRMALIEKKALLKEIHHRVKNNLQIIVSLLNMQSRSIKDKEASKQIMESRDRVFSMSLIHENLYQSEKIVFVDVRKYLNKLAINLFHSYNKKIELEINISKIYFVIDQALPCGLILNELITNSLKHSYKDGRKGRIKIDLSMENSGLVTLIYYDDGAEFPNDIDIKGAGTLGLKLINTLVKQLDATMDIENGINRKIIIKFIKQEIDQVIEV